MFGVLAASLGVAALVDHARPSEIGLDEVVSLGDVSIGLPGSWDISLNQKLGQVRAAENDSQNAARRVIIVQRQMQSWLDRMITPPPQRQIPFGALGEGSISVTTANTGVPSSKRVKVLARCDLSDGTTLAIAMDAPAGADGAVNPIDLNLIQHIAASAKHSDHDD